MSSTPPRCATISITFFISAAVAFCQSDSLALSSGATSPGGTVSLNLSLASPSGRQPAGIEWTFTYSTSNVVAISASSGAAATAAGKSLSCASRSGSLVCFLTGLGPHGLNQSLIQNGVVAVVTVRLAATTSSTTIGVTNALSASAGGAAIQTTATSGTVTAVATPSLKSLNCGLGALASGVSTTCTVSLVQPAPSGGSTVSISDNSSLLATPAAVTVPAGVASATFTARAGTVTSNVSVTLTAKLNGSSQTAAVALVLGGQVSSLSCNPTSLTPGRSSTCTVRVSQNGGISRTVQLTDNSSVLTTPTSVFVPGGATSATFTAAAGSATRRQSATITASLNGSVSATLSLSPASLAPLSCDSMNLSTGSTSNCTITLIGPASPGGVTVAVSSDSSTLLVPASVIVPALSSTATFPVTVADTPASGQSTVAVTAALNGASQSIPFAVTICPCSVWTASARPANPDSNDDQTIEVGMRFLPEVAGYVTGIRFFKTLKNTGTHSGHLWSADGELLATVTFTNETKSGWQVAYFPSPVAVTPNNSYVISYNAPRGHYAADSGFFTSAPRTPPLRVLADGENGPNGVYQYGSGGFPTTSASATNFWVDPVFNTAPTIGRATPVSLWTPETVPNTAGAPTWRPAQLGLTFISGVSGYVTGVRYYKSPMNTGTHLGYLWTSTGTLLASVTFMNESAFGWQQANFATPVAINPNTSYIVSYWSPRGHYANDAGYFGTSGITNRMLYAPPDGQYGPNGSYATSNVFPAGSAGPSNYWVDVVLSTAIE